MPAIIDQAGRKFNVDEADGVSRSHKYAGAYMLDIVHHVEPAAVRPLLAELYATLAPGARLVVKDVDRWPAYKRWFTHALDLLANLGSPPYYWAAEALQDVLEEAGFRVFRHAMVDFLPYPHVLYVCRKPGR